MDQILDNLWIGSIKDAREEALSEYGISHVVTVCQDSVESNVGCGYSIFKMSDGEQSVYGGRHDYDFFRDAVNKVVQLVKAGETVFVHCHRGISRSGAVTVAAVGRIRGVSQESAIDIVTEARPKVSPNEVLSANVSQYLQEYN